MLSAAWGTPCRVFPVSLQLDVHKLTILGPESRYIGVGKARGGSIIQTQATVTANSCMVYRVPDAILDTSNLVCW